MVWEGRGVEKEMGMGEGTAQGMEGERGKRMDERLLLGCLKAWSVICAMMGNG